MKPKALKKYFKEEHSKKYSYVDEKKGKVVSKNITYYQWLELTLCALIELGVYVLSYKIKRFK